MKRIFDLFRRLLESVIFVVGAITILEYCWAHWPKIASIGTGLFLFSILTLWLRQHFYLPFLAGLRETPREQIESRSQPPDTHSPSAQGAGGR